MSFSWFSFFTAPSLLPSLCTSSFLHAPFIPLIDGLHLWKCRGFGSVYDYRIQRGAARGREDDSKDTWKKRWKVTLLTLGSVDGGRAGGAAKWKCGHSERQEVNPPQVLCQCWRGVPGQPTGTADIMSPSCLSVEPLKEAACEWWKVGGLQVAAETWDKTNTHTDTMDTNPEILMPMVVAHWKRREGVWVCVFEVFWQIIHTPLLLVKKVAVKGYLILASPLSPFATAVVIMYAY